MDLPAPALLEAILEGARSPMFVLTRDARVVEVNRAALAWMDARREAVVGRCLREQAPWDQSPALRAWIDEAIEDAAAHREGREVEVLRQAFSIRAVHVCAESGQDLFIAEGADLARVEAERSRTRFAFEAANLSTWTWDIATNTVNSQSDRGAFGLPPHVNATREQAVERIQPQDRVLLLAAADEAVGSRSGFRVEVSGLVTNGETRWVAVSGVVRCDETGQPMRIDGITVDITERKETELRLRESESRFRSIFENAGIGIALVSPEGVPIESNPALEQLLGYSAAELRKMRFTEFTHPDDIARDWALYQELMAGRRKRYEVEKRYIRKSGALLSGKLVVSLVRDAAGNPEFGIGMVEDITERKLVEAEVRALSDKLIHTQEQERSRIGRELHDGLGQQIAALSIAVSGLKRQIPEQEAEPRAQIERLKQRIAAIAEGLRRISHELHPAVLELAGIVAALRSFCAQFSADNRVEVALDANGDFEGIPSEVALCLYRVAQEALQNVAKHSGAKTARVLLERSEDEVHLTVTDHGRGFDASAPRAGLGLVSIKERARLLNGRMSVTSAPGEGTTLGVSIPLTAVAV